MSRVEPASQNDTQQPSPPAYQPGPSVTQESVGQLKLPPLPQHKPLGYQQAGYQEPGPPQPSYQQQPMGHHMQTPMVQPEMHPHPMYSMGQQQQMTTVVINNQPGQQRNPLLVGTRNGTRDWTSGLCGCCEDIGSCCMTFWCSGASACSIAVRVGDSFCMPLCVPDAGLAMRVRVRGLGDIKGSICNDCLVMCCCGPCGACQMHRELDAMGL
ncbi:placenta-specific gene 8 protein-like [Dreissena polymorpha]|uniref:Cornifelin n=1 Tax=Dreissena polymorpha TaxID=45954 RepID=A0A9D4CNH9_DREPO|nr:placenta-specific gene 8 protein-like [Dreissena polymorpha]KAH3728689.1 hypothetical protein DPMN_054649 [Dreissena polymorpha]